MWLDGSFYYRCDSKQKIETLSVFLLSLATQRHATRRWKRCPLNTLENYVFIVFAIYIAPIAIAMKRCYCSDSYLKLSLSQHSTVQRRWKQALRVKLLIQVMWQPLICSVLRMQQYLTVVNIHITRRSCTGILSAGVIALGEPLQQSTRHKPAV